MEHLPHARCHAATTTLAMLAIAACGFDADVPDEHSVARSLADDPAEAAFDPASCVGQPLTLAEAFAKFPPGSSEVALGEYELVVRTRTCTGPTGCSAWSDPSRPQTGGLVPQPLGGTLSLAIDGAGHLLVRVRDRSIEEMTGYYPEFVASGEDGSLAPYRGGGEYRYEWVDQQVDWTYGWPRAAGPEFQRSAVLETEVEWGWDYSYDFEIAALTDSCARIVSTNPYGETEQYGLLVLF